MECGGSTPLFQLSGTLLLALSAAERTAATGFFLRSRTRRYTNAACDEIKRRLEFDPLVEVSTIHSFVGLLISGLPTDIKQWLRANLAAEIDELEEQQRKGKSGTKAALSS